MTHGLADLPEHSVQTALALVEMLEGQSPSLQGEIWFQVAPSSVLALIWLSALT